MQKLCIWFWLLALPTVLCAQTKPLYSPKIKVFAKPIVLGELEDKKELVAIKLPIFEGYIRDALDSLSKLPKYDFEVARNAEEAHILLGFSLSYGYMDGIKEFGKGFLFDVYSLHQFSQEKLKEKSSLAPDSVAFRKSDAVYDIEYLLYATFMPHTYLLKDTLHYENAEIMALNNLFEVPKGFSKKQSLLFTQFFKNALIQKRENRQKVNFHFGYETKGNAPKAMYLTAKIEKRGNDFWAILACTNYESPFDHMEIIDGVFKKEYKLNAEKLAKKDYTELIVAINQFSSTVIYGAGFADPKQDKK